jgi:5-bromo-4-chloroindolyl phosphate hydrolysis protein
MRKLLLTVVVGTALLSLAADKPSESIDQLKTRAAASDKSKQAELYVDLARRQLESANDLYNANTDQARELFVASADSAELASKASIASNHKLKQTEIKLRELSHRMSDIRKTWAFEDRAPLDPAIQRVEVARTNLLDRMFHK